MPSVVGSTPPCVPACKWPTSHSDLNNSESGHSDVPPRSPDKPLHIFPVACKNHRLPGKRDRHHNGIHHIRGLGLAKQSSCFVCLGFSKRHYGAAGQEAPQLNLLWRSADLGHYRRRNQGHNTKF